MNRVARAAIAVALAIGVHIAAGRSHLAADDLSADDQSSDDLSTVRATRFTQNPLVTLQSSPTLGDNINGPSIIRVPPWIDRPLGRYYMYFAHHMGHVIRLAYADQLTGPWKIHEPGVLPVSQTAFFRPQPDPPENLENFYTHVASPEVVIDDANKRLVMWFHGWYSDGKQFPAGDAAARRFAQQNGYTQSTQSAESSDGLRFTVHPAITRASYLRAFTHDGVLYGMARAGLLLRTKDPFASFEAGPNPFRDGPNASRVRHVAVTARGRTLYTFFSAIGDAPERIMLTAIDRSGDWTEWKTAPAVELLQPSAPYECPTLPNVPSLAGDIKGPARQMRDPAIFEEGGRTFLFYSICGEQGIAGAEVTLPAPP